MSSLNMFLAPATTISSTNITTNNNSFMITKQQAARRVQTFATSAKGTSKGSSSEDEGGFLEWLGTALQKKSFVETDPILQRVDEKSGGTTKSTTKSGGTTTITGKKTTSSAPPKKAEGGFGGLGGLFAKK